MTNATHQNNSSITATEIGSAVERDGFAIVEAVLSHATVDRLLTALKHIGNTESVRKRDKIFAIRNLLDMSPEVRELANSESVCALVEPILETHFFAVRSTLFDKIADANWKVPWHQDVAIAVQQRVEANGFGPWSMKADVLHVQPPAEVLEHMISVRIHLDPCGEENGALRVLPGSHQRGRIPEQAIRTMRETPEVVCAVELGGALLMRPLLLHASSPSSVPGHRRVVHLDFASTPLPNGMQWFSDATSATVRLIVCAFAVCQHARAMHKGGGNDVAVQSSETIKPVPEFHPATWKTPG